MQTSRRRSGPEEDKEPDSVQAPAAAPQMQGDQLLMPPPPQQTQDPEQLSRHEIRDRVAMGGMSSLELQNLVRSNVFLTDEDISAWTGGKGGGGAGMNAQSHSAPAHIAAPPEDMFARHAPNPHAAPLGGHEALGAEGAKAPQGLLAPQGVMTKVGMVGFVKGLMGIRSDMPQPGAMSAKQQSPKSKPSSTASPTQSSPKSAAPNSASAPSTRAEPAQDSKRTQAQTSPPPSQTPEPAHQHSSSSFSPVAMNQDTQRVFEPVAEPSQGWLHNALWGRSKSPFVELFQRILKLIKSLFGSEDQVPPHLRGGGGH